MLKYNKGRLYIKNIFHIIISNKARFVLTLIGFSVGTLIFSLGNILIDSYYSKLLKEANSMSDKIVFFKTDENSQDIIKKSSAINNIMPNKILVLNSENSIFSIEYQKDKHFSLVALPIGVSDTSEVNISLDKQKNLIPEDLKLIKGRNICSEDIISKRKVMVVDQFAEKILFSDKNAIGKKIHLKGDNDQYEIIGVIESSFQSMLQTYELKQGLHKERDSIIIKIPVYIPITIINDKINENSLENYYLFNCKDPEHKMELVKTIDTLIDSNPIKYNNVKLITKETKLTSVVGEYKEFKFFLNLLIIVLLLITGISVMSIIFFSVKERISEIGIRKTLGAGKIDILFQFIAEGVIIAMIAAIISMIIAIFFAKGIEWYSTNVLYYYFKASFSIKNLITPICVSLINGILFSIFPSIYAMKISIVDSLRFE